MAPAESTAPARVLLVDDHAIVRRGLRSILELEPDISVVAEAGRLERCTPGPRSLQARRDRARSQAELRARHRGARPVQRDRPAPAPVERRDPLDVPQRAPARTSRCGAGPRPTCSKRSTSSSWSGSSARVPRGVRRSTGAAPRWSGRWSPASTGCRRRLHRPRARGHRAGRERADQRRDRRAASSSARAPPSSTCAT